MAQTPFRPPEDPLEDLPEPQPELQGEAVTSLDCSSNVYEKQELLHRPHAFALMHGDGGAKIAYGELHWAIDVLIANFKTTVISVNNHSDHSHAPHDDHSHGPHSDHADHSHSSHTTSNHQHTHAHTHNVEDHTHDCGSCGSGSGSGSTGSMDGSVMTQGANPETTGSAGAETLSHSGVQTTGPSYGSASGQGILEHSAHTGTKNVSDASQDAPDGVLEHSGVKDVSDGTTTATGVLEHTVNNATIEHVDSMGQQAIPAITQQVPNIDTEDGDPMVSLIPNEYFQLTGFGDVYLVWKVDLELAPEVQKCWVQVGDPGASNISSTGVDKTETNRLSEIPVKDSIATEGTYSVKIGTVTDDNRIQQRVSSDVSWRPFVLDRTRS